MLCPYHGSYNAKLDRCPGCVESRQHTRASAAWIVPVEMAELASLRARIAAAVEECERIEQLPYAALSGMAALPLREAARMIRAKLENG